MEASDTPTEVARDDQGLCGPEGILFEKRRIDAAAEKTMSFGRGVLWWLAGFGVLALGDLAAKVANAL